MNKQPLSTPFLMRGNNTFSKENIITIRSLQKRVKNSKLNLDFIITPFLKRQITTIIQFFVTTNLPTTCEQFVNICIFLFSWDAIKKLFQKTRASGFIMEKINTRHHQHTKTINALGLRPRAFISFLVFGNHVETLALIFLNSTSTIQFLWCKRRYFSINDKGILREKKELRVVVIGRHWAQGDS